MNAYQLQLSSSSATFFDTIGRKLALAFGISHTGRDPVAELLKRAAEYEASQPSFAADLRAAAAAVKDAQV